MRFAAGFCIVLCAISASASTLQPIRRAEFTLSNGEQAIALNNQFGSLTPNSPCTGDDACVNQQFAQCIGGKFALQACAPGTICAALPLVSKPGTSITCTTAGDRDARIAATGATTAGSGSAGSSSTTATPSTIPSSTSAIPSATSAPTGGQTAAGSGSGGSGDAQTSLTLDPAVIAQGFANNGQDVPTAGQVASLTSTNNFINFCLTVNLPLTNGAQVVGGSCNPAPMGAIPAKTNMPTSKFVFPANSGTVQANQAFTIKMKVSNLETGNFVNANSNYFSAPQQLNDQGIIKGHSHVVIQQLSSLDSIDILDPTVFAFFKGLNSAAQNGILSVDVTNGLPAGSYKLSSINTAANHQPVLAPVAQHGSLDDAVYFTVQ